MQMQGLHPAQLFALMGHAFPGGNAGTYPLHAIHPNTCAPTDAARLERMRGGEIDCRCMTRGLQRAECAEGGSARERSRRAMVELLHRRASVQALRVSARSSEQSASLHRTSRLQTVLSKDGQASTGSASRRLLASNPRPPLTMWSLMSIA